MKLINIYTKAAIINSIRNILLYNLVLFVLVALLFFVIHYFNYNFNINELTPEFLILLLFLSVIITFPLSFLSFRLFNTILAKKMLPKGKNQDIQSINLLKRNVNFNFSDKKLNISYPYEMFKSTSLKLHCFEYQTYAPRIRQSWRQRHLLIIPTLSFTFQDGKCITMTALPIIGRLTFTAEINFGYIYKIIDLLSKSGNFKYFLETQDGIMEFTKTLPAEEQLYFQKSNHYAGMQERIEWYITERSSFPYFKRFCDKYEKKSYINASLLIFLIALVFIFLEFTSKKLYLSNQIIIFACALISLATIYIDFGLIKDAIFDYKNHIGSPTKHLLIWLIPITKISLITLCWWLLKINYYI